MYDHITENGIKGYADYTCADCRHYKTKEPNSWGHCFYAPPQVFVIQDSIRCVRSTVVGSDLACGSFARKYQEAVEPKISEK